MRNAGMVVVLLSLLAGGSFALEWNPLDDLRDVAGTVRDHVPFLPHRPGPSELPRVFIYSASQHALLPARALIVPWVHQRAERETVERLTYRYGQAVAPMLENTLVSHHDAPTAEPDPAADVLPPLLVRHEQARRLDDPDLLARLSRLDVNLVLVVEVPTYRQYWAERSKLTEVEMSAVAYECEGGTPLFRVREVARSGRNYQGQAWDVVEERALSALLEKTRGRLVEQESVRRGAMAAEAAARQAAASGEAAPPDLPPGAGVAI